MMWSWYLVPCFIGLFLRDRIKPLNVLGAGLGTGIGFFLTSNFAVWAFGNIAYAKNLSGFIECYTKAIPFFRNGMISDVVFSLVFFGIGALVAQTQLRIESKSAAAQFSQNLFSRRFSQINADKKRRSLFCLCFLLLLDLVCNFFCGLAEQPEHEIDHEKYRKYKQHHKGGV